MGHDELCSFWDRLLNIFVGSWRRYFAVLSEVRTSIFHVRNIPICQKQSRCNGSGIRRFKLALLLQPFLVLYVCLDRTVTSIYLHDLRFNQIVIEIKLKLQRTTFCEMFLCKFIILLFSFTTFFPIVSWVIQTISPILEHCLSIKGELIFVHLSLTGIHATIKRYMVLLLFNVTILYIWHNKVNSNDKPIN